MKTNLLGRPWRITLKTSIIVIGFILVDISASSQSFGDWGITAVNNQTYSIKAGGTIDFVFGQQTRLDGYAIIQDYNRLGESGNVYLYLTNPNNNTSKSYFLTGIAAQTPSLTFSVLVYIESGWNARIDFRSTYTNFKTSGFITFNSRGGLYVSDGKSYNANCGQSIQLNPIVSGGTPPYLYTWSPSTGLNSSKVANPTTSPLSANTTYNLTVKDSSTPIAQTTTTAIVINVAPLSSPTISGSSIFYLPCPNERFPTVNNYYVTGLPSNATAVNWNLTGNSKQQISNFYYTSNLATGIAIASTNGGLPLPMAALVSSSEFTISCSYSTPFCVSKLVNFVVTEQNKTCRPIGPILLSASPNPTSNKTFSINYSIEEDTNLDYRLLISEESGKKVIDHNLGKRKIGSFTEEASVGRSGTYIVEITNGSTRQVQRVIVKD